MRTLLSLLAFFVSLTIVAQAPHYINYQGVARNTNGTPIVGPIAVRVEIHQGAINGGTVCSEVFHISTNQYGIFDLRIGSVSPGQFGSINWGASSYFVGVAIDPTGGNNFGSDISSQQLVSVPYALYAEKAGSTGPGGSLTASSNVTVTSSGTNSFNINVPNYVAGANVSITPTSGNNYQISAGFSPTMFPVGPWTSNTGTVTLVNSSDVVGIGGVPTVAKLDIYGGALNGAFISSGGNGVLAVTTSSSSSTAAVIGNNQGGNPSGPGVSGVSSSSTNAGVNGVNTGIGPGVYGRNNVNGNNPTAHGVLGETSSTSASAAAVFANNQGQGYGVYALTSSGNLNIAAVHGQNTAGDGVRGQTQATQTVIAGVKGSNTGVGPGVYGFNNIGSTNIGANGVRGESNSTNPNTAGVSGETFGSGSGVHGISNNPSAAMRAQSGATSTLALWIDGGHIKSSQPNPPNIATYTTSGGASLVSYTTTGCTDVKGTVLAVVTTTGMINIGGQVGIRVTFSKAYPNPPTVVVTPTSDFMGMTWYVNAITPQYFQMYLKNNTATNILGNPLTFNFTYMVIE